MITMNNLINDVLQWAEERDLLNKDNAPKQFLKVVEEVGEISAALARNNDEELVDAIGDTLVTLIILADQKNMSIEHCLRTAYNEIKDRKGATKDGVFIKD